MMFAAPLFPNGRLYVWRGALLPAAKECCEFEITKEKTR